MINIVFGCGGHYKTTAGKESPFIPSLGRRIKEWEFNEAVWQQLMVELKKHGIVTIDCAPGERDTPLKERTDYANKIYWQYCSQYGKANVNAIYISEHYDAFDGTFDGKNPSGFTVYIYKGQSGKESGKLAKLLVEELSKGTKQVNRGVKEADLHIVRETVMPAALAENGFMDNPEEALLMVNPSFQREVVTEQARAICRYFGVGYVSEPQPTPSQQPTTSGISIGSTVTVKKTATHYQTGQAIASFVRGSKYKVKQVKAVSQSYSKKAYLLDGILSWVLEQDVEESGVSNTGVVSQPVPAQNVQRHVKIVNVNSNAIMMDNPDRVNAANIGIIPKGTIVDMIVPVTGYNNPGVGYYKIVYNGKTGYINAKFGQEV